MYSNSCCGLADMSIQSAEKIYTHNPIQTLSNGTVLVDYGPMRMFISVFEKGKPLVTLAKEGRIWR